MRTRSHKREISELRLYDRAMLRSAFVSLFWCVITNRRECGNPMSLAGIAKSLSVDKSVLSRWFGSRMRPNWETNTIADLAHVLDVDVEVIARDRVTGVVYTPSGIAQTFKTSTPDLSEGFYKIDISNIGPQTTVTTGSDIRTDADHDGPITAEAV